MTVKYLAAPVITLALLFSACSAGGGQAGTTASESGSTVSSPAASDTVAPPVSSDGTYPSVIFTVSGQTTASSAQPPDSSPETTAATSASSSAGTSATTSSSATSSEQTSSVTVPPAGVALPVPPPGKDLHGLTAAQAEAFYSDSVFVGDSIMMHWANYMTKQRETGSFFDGAKSLTAASLGVNNALWGISDQSVHPKYQGEQMQLWNSIPLTGAKKVIMMFGLNDVALYGVQNSVASYGKLINLIKTNVPDAQFYIVSSTYILKGAEKKDLKNSLLREWNNALIDFCSSNGYNFINIADALCDSDGYLLPEYCGDGFIHQTTAARVVWAELLRGYAADKLTGN